MLDESYVGTCKQLAQSCVAATEEHAVPDSFIAKYGWDLHFLYVHGDNLIMPAPSSA